MKKLLILGSDYGALDIAEKASEMGVYVVVSDLMETSPAREAADETWNISTTDTEALVKKVKEEHIDGCLAGASAFNQDMCLKLCKAAGLPHYCKKDEAWGVERDKKLFKKICQECGMKVATDYYLTDALTDEELNSVKFPVVVKPTDQTSSKGISFCNNKEELIAGYKYAREFSDEDHIIVERRLQGVEVTAYYVLAGGDAELMYTTTSQVEPGQPTKIYSIESLNDKYVKQYAEEVNENAKKMLKAADCTEGTAWLQLMYDFDDKCFYAIEMGYRFAGPVTYILFEKMTGFSTSKWMVECALGMEHTKEELPKPLLYSKAYGASYNLFANSDDEVYKISGLEEIKKLDNVMVDFTKTPGSKMRLHANSGVFRILGSDCEEFCKTVDKINSTLKIENKEGKNLYIKYTDFESLKAEYDEIH